MSFKQREFSKQHRYSLTSRLFKARKEAGITVEKSSSSSSDNKSANRRNEKKPRVSVAEWARKEGEEARKVKEQEREVSLTFQRKICEYVF